MKKSATVLIASLLAASTPVSAVMNPMLMHHEKATTQAPATFKVRFVTTQGPFVIQVHRDWSPSGADRFYNLVKAGFYNDVAFFRVIQGFMVQFGINGSPKVNAAWREATIQDDPASGHTNARGMVTFAKTGMPNSRTTQLFINFGDNGNLDGMGFTPFGQVIQGMDIVDKLYNGYGEGAPSGQGPDQSRTQAEGNAYLKKEFPKLDYIKTATFVAEKLTS